MAANTITAPDRAAAAQRFDALADGLRNRLSSNDGSPVQLFWNEAAVSARARGVVVSSTSFRGVAVAENRGDPVPLPVGAELRLELRGPTRTDYMNITLDAGMTLDMIAERLNMAIIAAPGLHGARFAVEKGEGWGLVVHGNSDDVILHDLSATMQAAVIGGASLSRMGMDGGVQTREVVGGVRDATGRDMGFVATAAVGDADGFLYAAGIVSQGDNSRHLLLKLDQSGALVWQVDAPAVREQGLLLSQQGILLMPADTQGSVLAFDQHGDRIMALKHLTGEALTTTAAAADPYLPGATLVALRSAGGSSEVRRIDATGATLARMVMPGTFSQISHLIATEEGILAAASIDGRAEMIVIPSDLSAVASANRLDLGPGRIAAAATNAGVRAIIRIGSDGLRELVTLAPASPPAVNARATLDFAATGVAIGDHGITLAGRSGDRIVSEIREAIGIAPLTRTEWTALSRSGENSSPLVAQWRAGRSTLAALGLRPGQLVDGDGRVSVARAQGPAPGDSFTIDAGGRSITISLRVEDSLNTLSRRIATALGAVGTARVATIDGRQELRIEARTPEGLSLRSGPTGRDLLSGLGIAPQRIASPRVSRAGDAVVQPGGTFALRLDGLPGVLSREAAADSRRRLDVAEAQLRSAYRSMFWDAGKETRAAGPVRVLSPAEAARIESYTAALRRLGG
ncbi:hypothetical protein [Sandaracinobacteroides saxicola]|uniref:Uncharacterized protein n=1 Tax=Sandaracinobacteroides saxicola TaxID=2759707 RepID=A0A7G5IJZ9_9SPHN|nr:hypothetical protein [Sandaracinobacteroides saxicola]QMW23691.1 hypothetical protein H3309_04160 [Sandaracinobacteroides saxicola]